MRSLILSCEKKGPQSFLSCEVPERNEKPNTRNYNLSKNCVPTLSVGKDNFLEGQSKSAKDYRAEKTTGAKSLIMGIDPGLNGALALITIENPPKFLAVFDFPTFEEKVGKRLKTRIDITDLALLIESYSQDINLACIEEVGQIGTKADPFSSFVFGFSTGLVHGVLISLGVKVQKIHPMVWKSSLGLDADKAKSLSKAIKLFPESAQFLKRKKDHDRAEALLLAYFAWKMGAR